MNFIVEPKLMIQSMPLFAVDLGLIIKSDEDNMFTVDISEKVLSVDGN